MSKKNRKKLIIITFLRLMGNTHFLAKSNSVFKAVENHSIYTKFILRK